MFLAQECSKQSSFEIFENVDILVSFGDKIENRGLGGVYRVGEQKNFFSYTLSWELSWGFWKF